MCNWQRVEDGLPPRHKDMTGISDWVLVATTNYHLWSRARVWFYDDGLEWYDAHGNQLHNVTHWATVELPGE